MARKVASVKLKTKTPPTAMVLRRRAVMIEAGLEHGVAAEAIQALDGVPTKRSSVTNTINGHFTSGGLRIEKRLVELIQQSLRQQGRFVRAKAITLDYLGWKEEDTAARMAG